MIGDRAATYIVSYSVKTALGEWRKKSFRTDLDGAKLMSRNWWKARQLGTVKDFKVLRVEECGGIMTRSLLRV